MAKPMTAATYTKQRLREWSLQAKAETLSSRLDRQRPMAKVSWGRTVELSNDGILVLNNTDGTSVEEFTEEGFEEFVRFGFQCFPKIRRRLAKAKKRK